jgi:hypothetical protein
LPEGPASDPLRHIDVALSTSIALLGAVHSAQHLQDLLTDAVLEACWAGGEDEGPRVCLFALEPYIFTADNSQMRLGWLAALGD